MRKHLEFYDDKPIHFGFFFGLPVTRYKVLLDDAFLNDPSFAIHSPSKTSFRMGFTVNRRLTDHFDIRTTPAVSLYDRTLMNELPTPQEKVRESTWIELPLLLKYKSKRRDNSRMYLIAGTTFSFETNVKNKVKYGAEQLNARKSDITIDYGVGFEQFFEFFKFTPELRFSHGLVNLANIPSNSIELPGVRKLTSHNVTLYLNFE